MKQEYVKAVFQEDYKIFNKGQYIQFPKHVYTGQIRLGLIMEELEALERAGIIKVIGESEYEKITA